MRILDRYASKQLVPVWIWCILVFVFVSCLIDLFGHLDEIIQYRVPARTIGQYYLNFMPMVFVRASPLALLFGSAFVVTRLVRYQELLAINASGTSLLRASIPFLFVGWVISLLVFGVNEYLVPRTSVVFERLRQEAFRGPQREDQLENVAVMDAANRLYHARRFDTDHNELLDLTVLEHNTQHQPTTAIYAPRAIYTRYGWLLLSGRISHLGPSGTLIGEPMPFVERLLPFPITPQSFVGPEMQPEAMRYGQLRSVIARLKTLGITNVRRHRVELASKVTLPLMNVVVCFIGFVGSTRMNTRGHLRGLGTSLGWGVAYYIGVATGHGIGKEGLLPVVIAVWLPHLVAIGLCLRALEPLTSWWHGLTLSTQRLGRRAREPS